MGSFDVSGVGFEALQGLCWPLPGLPRCRPESLKCVGT